jgi:hypothetical protein
MNSEIYSLKKLKNLLFVPLNKEDYRLQQKSKTLKFFKKNRHNNFMSLLINLINKHKLHVQKDIQHCHEEEAFLEVLKDSDCMFTNMKIDRVKETLQKLYHKSHKLNEWEYSVKRRVKRIQNPKTNRLKNIKIYKRSQTNSPKQQLT